MVSKCLILFLLFQSIPPPPQFDHGSQSRQQTSPDQVVGQKSITMVTSSFQESLHVGSLSFDAKTYKNISPWYKIYDTKVSGFTVLKKYQYIFFYSTKHLSF